MFVNTVTDGELVSSGGKLVKFDFDQIAGGENRVDGAGAAPKRINP